MSLKMTCYYSKFSSYCLICNNVCNPPNEELEVAKASQGDDAGNLEALCSCHSHPARFLGSLAFKWEDNPRFHQTVKYVFLLRKLLDYPRGKCVQYLRRRLLNTEGELEGEESTPGEEDGWFSICEICSKLVNEAHSIYHKTEELETRLAELKKILKETIVSAHDEIGEEDEGTEVQGNSDRKKVTIYSEVRSHFGHCGDATAEKDKDLPDQSIVKREILNLSEEEDIVAGIVDNLEETGHESDSDWSPPSDREIWDGDNDYGLDIKPSLKELGLSEGVTVPVSDKKSSKEKPKPKPIVRRSLRSRRKPRKLGGEKASDSETDEGKANEDDEEIIQEDLSSGLSEPEDESDDSASNTEDNSTQKSKSGGGKCKICSAPYVTKHRLEEHERLHYRSQGVIKCDHCQFVCKSNKALLMHTNKVHQGVILPTSAKKAKLDNEDGEEYKCSHCDVVYKATNKYKAIHRLREHEELHFRTDVLKCRQCNYVCLAERGLKIHVTKCHVLGPTTPTKIQPDKSQEVNPGTKSSENEQSSPEFSEFSGQDENSMDCEVDEEKMEDDNTDKAEKPKDEAQRYHCNICNASYQMIKRLREHKKLHKDPSALKCSHCEFVCVTQRHLKSHIGRVHLTNPARVKYNKKVLGGPYPCSKCPAVYKTKHRFKDHMALHKSSSSVSCPECKWVFSTKMLMERHFDIQHKIRPPKKIKKEKKMLKSMMKARERRPNRYAGPFNCDCGATYQDRYRFKEHVQQYHEDKLIECDMCKELYESPRILSDHQKICRGQRTKDIGDGLRLLRCKHCLDEFVTRASLRKHISMVHSTEKFPCSICEVVFPSSTKLRYHMSRAHNKQHNVCNVCGYKSHGQSHLRLHMQKHTKQKNYMCEICSKTFVSPTYLTAHKQKEHYEELGMEPIKCDQCDMLLPTKTILKYHVKKVHQKDFKYTCETCGKGFLFASSLRNHTAVHSTERNEICEFCGAAYVHNRVLMDHMKNHHPEEYAALKGIDPSTIPQTIINTGPFFCKFCNMEFSMRWSLHKHLKTHTEVYEKFKCGTCGRGYSSQAGVKRHEETAHLQTNFSCGNCGKEFSCRDYLRYHAKNHCKKNEADTSGQTSEIIKSEEDEAEIEIDPHVVNKAGQIHIVTPSIDRSQSIMSETENPTETTQQQLQHLISSIGNQ